MSYKNNSTKNSVSVIGVMGVVFVIIMLAHSFTFSCGGGVVPYVPSGAGASSGQSSGGVFFLFDKGVTTTMFDHRTLQPLFKNIVNSGNERKNRDRKGKKVKPAVKKKDLADCPDSTGKRHNLVEEGVDPVLNLHKLH